MYFLTNVNLVVPVVCAVAVIVIAIAVICVLRSGRREYPKGKQTHCLHFTGTLAPPFGKDPKTKKAGFPGLPEWLDLDIIVPVTATVVVICVGVLVVCVALTRRKPPPPLMNPGLIRLAKKMWPLKLLM